MRLENLRDPHTMAAVWQVMGKAQDVELGPILKNYLSLTRVRLW